MCFRLPGDTRTKVGFLTFDNTIHFYNLQEGLSQPQMLVVSDIDGKSAAVVRLRVPGSSCFYVHHPVYFGSFCFSDVFIPSHDSLMVNLKESKEVLPFLSVV